MAGRPDDPEAVRQGHRPGGRSSRNARRRNGPSWVDVAELRYASGTSAKEAVIHDAAGLAWAINLGCVDLNPHPVLADDLDHPDELRVDLDPMPGVAWRQIVDVAQVAREVLEDYGLTAWPKTSGSRGFHIYARIAPSWSFRQVRLAAQTVAREVERRAPELATSRWWKEEREGVFVDFNQNAKDRTVASAYSVRATPDARVSTPLRWDEVADCDPATFTVTTVPQRFAELGDPWAGMNDTAGSLDRLLTLAEELGPAEKAPKGARRERERAGVSRRCRSSRSPAPRPRTRRWPRWTPGATAIPPRPNACSRPTCWSTACADRVRSGTGFGSTCSMCPTTSGRRRRS